MFTFDKIKRDGPSNYVAHNAMKAKKGNTLLLYTWRKLKILILAALVKILKRGEMASYRDSFKKTPG